MLRTFLLGTLAIGILLLGVPLTATLAFGRQGAGSTPQNTPPPKENQQQNPPPKPTEDQNQQDQSVPDAPSAVQPAAPIPNLPPTPGSGEQNTQAPQPEAPPANQPPPRQDAPADQEPPGPRPPLNLKTVPEGGATNSGGNDTQNELFKIVRNVNQVLVPVTVKDESGHLVPGLLPNDFTVRENGKKQTLDFFTSDPFALSAAIILDLGMKDVDVQKVNHTFSALEGVFSPFDEVSIYSYSNAVSQLSGWTSAGQRLSQTLADLQNVSGRDNGPPVLGGGPLGPGGPVINNQPVDPNPPIIYTQTQESHVLNDAVLKAALDLSRRDPARRKVIFIISDGREYRSTASYRDVLKVLLSNNITVYAIGVGGSAIPGYNKLERIHLPRFGYSDILPRYANATGGEVSNELTRTGIEDAYTRLMGDARNQYTLGYITHEPLVGEHNDVEVLVNRPSCRRSSVRPCVDVTAKEGYYAMPQRR